MGEEEEEAGPPDADDKPEKVVEDLDQNKDGKLTLAEFTAEWEEEEKHKPREILEIFTAADKDKDGMLNLAEIQVIMDDLKKEAKEQEEKELSDGKQEAKEPEAAKQ